MRASEVRSPLTTIKNPCSAPPALAPAKSLVTNDLKHSEPAPVPPVTELHTFYSAFTFALAMIHPILNFYTIIQEANSNMDNSALKKYRLFWGWTIFPLSLGAMCISWLIKVRKDADLKGFQSFLTHRTATPKQYAVQVLPLYTIFCILCRVNFAVSFKQANPLLHIGCWSTSFFRCQENSWDIRTKAQRGVIRHLNPSGSQGIFVPWDSAVFVPHFRHDSVRRQS